MEDKWICITIQTGICYLSEPTNGGLSDCFPPSNQQGYCVKYRAALLCVLTSNLI